MTSSWYKSRVQRRSRIKLRCLYDLMMAAVAIIWERLHEEEVCAIATREQTNEQLKHDEQQDGRGTRGNTPT